jgi:hypothetical protein
MFTLDKDSEGKLFVRPAFIGFIKNNTARRTLMVVYMPFTWFATVVFNLLVSCSVFAVHAVWGIVKPTLGLILTPVWKSEVWHTPRKRL